jgi:hypothetical protein
MRTLPDAAGLPALLAVALALPPAGAAVTATDPSPVAGAVGVRTFTGSTNVILFDDVAVTDRIFTDGFESGDTVRWSATVP